ncbi:calcium-binding protein [Kaistia sp. 32K]|uniref:SMP-30/gluconolactonase/LRE family protein n=1 Tax=Kaistia sp. 32K TaxID=2795690 RepID=UPI0019150A8C|nr:SMP-30/gluconolactonase/LRE family protein [Kaistia sp. 32K]BCP56120.1 calcium-binding protein [Kaistia sp. 32K]
MEIKSLVNADTLLGEGPLWDVETQRLYWIDSLGNRVLSCDADGGDVREWSVLQNIGSMALRSRGGAILSLADGFHSFDFETGRTEPFALVDHGSPQVRMNDGKVDPLGRFVAGSLNVTETVDDARLYSLDVEGQVRVLDTRITVSNGPCWSPDGRIFYFADSRARAIFAYDYDLDTGAIGGKRVFCSFGPEDGLPDGATVDAEGCLWSAGVYKGKLHRFSPSGERILTLDMPVQSVTSVMFGGPDLDRLYVTTMLRPPVGDVVETSPLAGALLYIDDIGTRGLPERRYAG